MKIFKQPTGRYDENINFVDDDNVFLGYQLDCGGMVIFRITNKEGQEKYIHFEKDLL